MRVLAALAVFVLFSNVAFAFDIAVLDQNFVVPAGGSREIKAIFSSTRDETVNVDLVDEGPWLTLSATQVRVWNGNPKEVIIYVSPYFTTSPGLYKVTLSAESQSTKEKEQKDIFVSVIEGSGAAIEKIELVGDIEPSGTVTLRVATRNLDSVPGEFALGYTVSSSSGPILSKEISFSLQSEEKKVIEDQILFATNEQPGTYSIKAEILQGGVKLDASQQGFVMPKKPVVRQTLDEKVTLFKKSWKVTVSNLGNDAAYSTPVTTKVSSFESAFFSGTEPTEKVGSFYLWDISDLQPGESRVIEYSLDFTVFYMFIAAIGLTAWLFFVKMRTVHVRKFVMQQKHINAGEQFTIGLQVANKTREPIHEMEIRDFLPMVFDIKDTEGPKPVRKQTESGLELIWKLSNVKPDEERILTYMLIPNFGVQGRVELPRAEAVCTEKRFLSGLCGIGIETEKPVHHQAKEHALNYWVSIRKYIFGK